MPGEVMRALCQRDDRTVGTCRAFGSVVLVFCVEICGDSDEGGLPVGLDACVR